MEQPNTNTQISQSTRRKPTRRDPAPPVQPTSSVLTKDDRAELMATIAMIRDGADHLMEELCKIAQ